MKSFLRSWRPEGLTLLSGVLIPAAFPQLALSPLLLGALTPWFLALRKSPSSQSAFRQGVWLSVFMSLLGFFWVARAVHQYGGLPWSVSIGVLFVFALFNQIQFLAFAPVYHWLHRQWRGSLAFRPLAVGCLYAAIDWSLPKLFQDTLGHATYNLPWLRQMAAFGGAHLLTWWIVVCNELLTDAILARGSGSQRIARLRSQIPAWGVLALLLGLAAQEWTSIQSALKTPERTIRVAAIQGNIGDFLKVAAYRGYDGADEHVISTYLRLTDQALSLSPRPDVIVWPETAYPHSFGKSLSPRIQQFEQALSSVVASQKFLLISGGYDREAGQSFNAVFGLAPNAPPTWYRKSILLPFGEYIPLGDSLKATFRRLFPTMGFFGRGLGPLVLESSVPSQGSRLRYSPLVCYEALFPWFTRDAAQKGSELIVNVTNDSWFGAYGEPYLHLALSVFRSIETRISQIRATNTGVSALILPDGSIRGATPLFEEAILSESVPILREPQSLFRRWGEWFGPLCWALSILSILAWIRPLARRRGSR